MAEPLLQPPELSPEQAHTFHERAAILEFDGKLPREMAEALALAEVKGKRNEKSLPQQLEFLIDGTQSMTGKLTFTPALSYAPAPPAQRHSRTSVAAAEAIRPSTNRLRQRVLDYIESRGAAGATDQECQKDLGMDESTQRPRRWELAQARLITQAGTRRTKSGRAATVWVVENN